jgi:hypothetical protein
MASGPTPFDSEGGDLAPPDRSRAEASAEPPAGPGPHRRTPNYRFRRAVVVGGVVAVLVAASIVVGRMIGTGATDTDSGAIRAEWNRIVLVDERTGRVIVDDAAGEEVARIDTSVRTPTASDVVDSTLVVTGADTVAVVDVDAGELDEFDLGADTIVGPSGSALTMIAARPDAGRALLVHGPSGEVIDTDTFAPVAGARYEFAGSRSSPSGREVLVTDSGNFQSVLFAFDRDEPSFFPGLALAVDAELVVTAQNIGTDATVSVFDHAGEAVTTGRTASVRAGMITDTAVVLVTVDGTIVTMSASNGDTAEGEQLDIGAIEAGDVTTSGERLVVNGSTGTAIVDDAGEIVASFDAQQRVGDGRPPVGSSCIATVTSESPPEGDDTQIAVIDLSDGAVLAEAVAAEPILADASGCVIGATTSDGFALFGPDLVADLDTDGDLLAVSLDGRSVVIERDGRTLLLGVDDESAADEPIDFGPSGRSVHFTQT